MGLSLPSIREDNRRWWTLGAMCFALFMIMLDNTVVNVALPSIQRDLEVSVKEVSDRLALSLPGASRTVDALLRRGWVERREDPADRRMKRVGITPDGREVIDRIENARLAGLEDYAASLTREQRATLSSALSNLPHRS